VTVKKCCRIGDLLLEDGVTCDIGTASENWAPKVFLPKKKGFFEKTGQLPPFIGVNEEEKPNCAEPEVVKSSEIFIIGNGSLYLKLKHVTIGSNDNFCVDQEYSLVCRTDKESVPENMTTYKLTKCCGPSEAYHTKHTCVGLNKTDPLNNRKILERPNVNFDFDYKFPDCGDSSANEFAIAGPFSESNYDITTGIVKASDSNKIFERDQYCLDHVIVDGNYEGVKIFTCSEHYGTAPPIIAIENHPDDVRFAIYSIGLLISVLFLVATLLVGFLLLSNHHMLHWRCQTNYVICLLIGDLLLAITQISGNSLRGPMCLVFAHLMHFFFLSAFFWLNAMCFNIWWTFR
jgi:G protein-coupled receptor Mth (Methuselah protein)